MKKWDVGKWEEAIFCQTQGLGTPFIFGGFENRWVGHGSDIIRGCFWKGVRRAVPCRCPVSVSSNPESRLVFDAVLREAFALSDASRRPPFSLVERPGSSWIRLGLVLILPELHNQKHRFPFVNQDQTEILIGEISNGIPRSNVEEENLLKWCSALGQFLLQLAVIHLNSYWKRPTEGMTSNRTSVARSKVGLQGVWCSA